MKKIFKKILKPIKNVVKKVGKFFGRVMNKLGPLGMFAMMIAMPTLSNFWSSMGNAIGGTATGGQVAATAAAEASATASATGATASQAANLGAEAGRQAAKEVAKKAGEGALKSSLKSAYASGTGQATGLFAGGTASKALGYTLKTLHNTASLGMNVFSTLTGAVSGALDLVSGGSLTKLGNFFGDRFGDFQTRMGMATSEGYKTRLGDRLKQGQLSDGFLEVVKKRNPKLFSQYKNFYTPEGEFIDSEKLITQDLPSFKEMRESGSLLVDADPDASKRMYPSVSAEGDITTRIDPTVKPEVTPKPTATPDAVYEGQTISAPEMTFDPDSLLASVDTSYGNIAAPDISGVETYKTFGQKITETASGVLKDIRQGIMGGERTIMVDEYAVDSAGVSFPTGERIAETIIEPNIIQKASSAAGDAIANLPKKTIDNYQQSWIDRKLGNVPQVVNNYTARSEIPGITYDQRNDFVTELPRTLNDENLITANNYNNLNQGVYSANPFAAIRPDRPNIDYGTGGMYGA
tara:strand:- start:8046 stop:9611 length:1566 start_codon:yes stop_codon:yes gene_type:complete